MANFIEIISQAASGVLGALTRSVVLVTRETVSGYTADPETGLYKINSTDLTAFVAANPAQYGLINALYAVFNQTFSYQYVYILSTGGAGAALTSAMLDQANLKPRDWSFLTLVSQSQGISDEATYFADLETMGTWATAPKQKIIVHTWSEEEYLGAAITLPAQLALGGSIGSNSQIKTIVSNSKHTISGNDAYDNVALAWLTYCINSAVSRSWGSLSDAHDFEYIGADSFGSASRSVISNASLGQYNGAKDRAGSLFVYDTQMNSGVNPPTTSQIESLTAQYYVDDYVYVLVHNVYQAPGMQGLANSDPGIQQVAGTVKRGLRDCFDLNLILAKTDGSADFNVSTLTADQVTVLSPNWQTTGVWPAGVITATIRPFSAAHYITLVFNFQ